MLNFLQNKIVISAIIIRLILIFYGDYQDQTSHVKYTDIDYHVYTDGSYYVLQGKSPFKRHTYRYTPVLAWMMTPNIFLHRLFGKFVFSIMDIVVGYLIYKLLKLTTNHSNSFVMKLTAIWLLNPIIFNVSTRGSADSIVSYLIVQTIYLLLKNKISLAGLVYGIAVHFRIYPIIYCIPLYFYIDRKQQTEEEKKQNQLVYFLKNLFTVNRLKFTFISASVFIGSIALLYLKYGYEFLFEAYLYHFARKDNRHNFSVYFYFIYLHFENLNKVLSTLSFLPQLSLVVFSGLKLYKDLPFCLFVQTFFFVIFNKVCTAQYFIWYMCFFPLILANNKLFQENKSSLKLYIRGFIWLASELLWNLGSYYFEFEGKNVFLEIFIACVLFFCVNVELITQIIKNQNLQQFMIKDKQQQKIEQQNQNKDNKKQKKQKQN